MQKSQKEAVVTELTERLRSSESLLVADYRGLTNAELAGLRAALRDHGAKLQVVKNTLTRRASEAAGTDALFALLEGPTAIAFVESDGDPVAVAKALSDTARETKVLTLRGGILAGRTITSSEIEELAKLPPAEVVKSQLVGVIVAPLTQLLGLLTAPVRDLVGLIDARIAQLEEGGDGGPSTEADASEEDGSGEASPEAVAVEEPPAEVVASSDEGGSVEAEEDSTDETGASASAEVPDTEETSNGD